MNRIDILRQAIRDKFKQGNLNFSLPENEIYNYIHNYDQERIAQESSNIPYTPFIDDGSYSQDKAFELAQQAYRNEPLGPVGRSFNNIYNDYLEGTKAYNYNRWYNMSNAIERKYHQGHYYDSLGKTAWHPTASIESPYSGYVNPYNPNGIEFGRWEDNTYTFLGGYHTKGHHEYNAHTIIEPAIIDYITGKNNSVTQGVEDYFRNNYNKGGNLYEGGSEIKLASGLPIMLEDSDQAGLHNTLPEVVVTNKDPNIDYYTVNDKGQLVPNITNTQAWQQYWGNQGAGYVNKARDKFATNVIPYALSFINPSGLLSTIGGIAGETAGSYLGNKIGGTTGEAIGGFTGGLLGGLSSQIVDNSTRIANNIANRNKFFYQYLEPQGYDHPWDRGMTVVKHVLKDETPELWEDLKPKYKYREGLGSYFGPNQEVPDDIADLLGNRFRDQAYRKYLGLPETEPLYIDVGDGTFKYNMPYIKQEFDKIGLKLIPNNYEGTIPDFVTGNGGNVNSKIIKFGQGILEDRNKTFGIQQLSDTWDLHPFSRKHNRLDTYFKNWIKKGAARAYSSKRKSKFDKFLLDVVFGNYDKRMDKILKPIGDKAAKIEVGPILKGKPFNMKQDIPFTRQVKLSNDSNVGISIDYGFNAENILPQEALDWKRGIQSFPTINKPNYNVDFKNLTTPTNIFRMGGGS